MAVGLLFFCLVLKPMFDVRDWHHYFNGRRLKSLGTPDLVYNAVCLICIEPSWTRVTRLKYLKIIK